MLFTPIYIAMTFIKTWRIRSFRARLLEFLSGNTSVAFCKVPENAAETPTLSSKLCTNPKNAYLCDLLDYTNATRICSMKPNQCIELTDWVSCGGGLPLGSNETPLVSDLDVDILLECEMEPHEASSHHNIMTLESMGQPVAWKAGSHLAIVLKTNMELLSVAGFNFVGGEFIVNHKLPVVRIQTVQLSGEPNKATDPSMRNLRSDIQHALKTSPSEFQWPIHAAMLRKLSKVVDIKSDVKGSTIELNGSSDNHLESTPIAKRSITLADVSVNTSKSLTEDTTPEEKAVKTVETIIVPEKKIESSPEKKTEEKQEEKNVIVENVTVEIQHNITPKKSSLKLDLKKGTSQLSASLMNISSQIKSVTTHKRVTTTTGPKKTSVPKEEANKAETKESPSQQSTPKSAKSARPLVNTKSPNVLIYSDSLAARDSLEATLRKVLDCDRYTLYSVSSEALESGAWRGRAALVAVAGAVGRAAPLLLAHLLDGGRLLALCSDLLHTVLPYYKTAEVRENEVVQFSYDKWKSVKMKHHIFCYQASPAKKQFSTETDRQPSKYTGHPGHELDIQILASEETWRTPSLLQATDLTNQGIAIFSQIHLEADPADYLGEEGLEANEARLEIIHKILGDILGLHVQDPHKVTEVQYTRGFFLGNHVDKLSLIEEWCGKGTDKRVQKLGDVTVQWCLRGDEAIGEPSASFLPVQVHECPDHFDTVEYFDNLTSKHVGRLVIYSEVLCSTQTIAHSAKLSHGIALVARRQTAGRGRGGNKWVSPLGQAVCTVQLWQKVSPTMTLVQHAAALAAVRAIRSLPAYEHLDIRIKWPNDIYYGDVKIGGTLTTASCIGEDAVLDIGIGLNISNRVPTVCLDDIITEHNLKRGTALANISIELFLARYCTQLEIILDSINTEAGIEVFLEQYYQYWMHEIKWPNDIYYGREVKIGGNITTANCFGEEIIINTGTGVNISNKVPTTCINDIISEHNRKHGTALAPMSIERFLARYCSQLERTLDYMNTDGGIEAFLEQYYQYWLHDNEQIRVQKEGSHSPIQGTICGLDSAGWLKVRTDSGDITVAPDGNTFDIMSGLIAPKL